MTPDLKIECRKAALSSADWIADRLAAEADSGPDCADLACWYKPPYLMQLAGRPELAQRLLDRIAQRYQRPNGDFLTTDEVKTADPALALFPGYINGWITMAAQRMGRFDLSQPGWAYLRGGFYDTAQEAFTLEKIKEAVVPVIDTLMCAHLGLAALYMGELRWAEGAGRALGRILDRQPEELECCELRMTGDGVLITDYPAEAAGMYRVDAHQPGQAWFMIGYPMAFLARLHRAIGEPWPLRTAHRYLAFAERCAPQMISEHFAHKVAWGAAELAAVTGEEAPRALSTRIVEHLLAARDGEGTWMGDQPPATRIDQSAEVAIWLMEIAALG